MSIQTYTIEDPRAGSAARVSVGLGFNCYSFTVPCRDQALEILWAAEGFDAGQERPSGSGIPLLFPFPGRLPGERFTWRGRHYSIPAGDGRGNAIHGFALNRPWRTTGSGVDFVTGEFHASQDDPALLELWPADFRLVATYQLDGHSLTTTLVAHNPSDTPLPCGFGAHPYFRLPLGGNSAAGCVVTLPVRREWELVNMLPTGVCSELRHAEAYRQGLTFGQLQLDNVFTDLEFRGGVCTPTVADPNSGVRVVLSFDTAFRECVVYTPPHREAICIEPYTCLPGAASLDKPFDATGWRILEPGESLTARYEIRVEME